MSQVNTREICLFNSATVTTTGTGPDINLVQGWQAAIVSAVFTTASGTSPTINLIIQNKLGQAAATDTAGSFLTGTPVYDDLLAFTQVTTTGTRICRIVTVGQVPTANANTVTTVDYALANGTLTAGSLRQGPLGGIWRLNFTIGGTSPSFGFAVVAQLIPFAT